jgi:hypothetical protein
VQSTEAEAEGKQSNSASDIGVRPSDHWCLPLVGAYTVSEKWNSHGGDEHCSSKTVALSSNSYCDGSHCYTVTTTVILPAAMFITTVAVLHASQLFV